MRDPKRIPHILAAVRRVWEQHPDLRLGQLLMVVAGLKDLFGIEDEDLEDLLDAWWEKKGPG